MKFKSIRLKIAFGASLAMLILAVIIITVAFLMMRNQTDKTRKKLLSNARSNAGTIAREYTGNIETRLDEAFCISRTLATLMATYKSENSQLELGRGSVNEILKGVLTENPDIVGVYTCWEPNAFDEADEFFKDKPGHDKTGRLIPYWSRDEKGEIACAPLEGYDVEKDGDYYLLPKKTMRECVIEPYEYSVQGKDTLITSLVVPIIVNGKFQGITGVDLSLDFLQDLTDNAKDLFDGKSTVVLISNGGLLAGVTGKPGLIGKHMKNVHNDFQEDLSSIQKGAEIIEMMGDELEVFMPIKIGKTITPWSVNMLVPQEVFTIEVEEQERQAVKNVWLMTIIMVVCTLAAMLWLLYIAHGIAKPISGLAKLAGEIEKGNLDVNVKVESTDEVGQLSKAFSAMTVGLRKKAELAEKIANGDLSQEAVLASDQDTLGKALKKMLEGLGDTVSQIVESAALVKSGGVEISDASQSLSQGATEQASSLEEISSSMSEIGSRTKNNAENATQADQLTNNARKETDKGGDDIQAMVQSMNDINESSQQIAKIIKTIDDIAFQTNILALNAAVEAARAGQHGKGFAVVADEVRTLAGRSAKAAAETATLIESALNKVNNGQQVAGRTAESFETISTGIVKVADLVGEIAAASNEQAEGIAQINQGLTQIDQITQQNTANAEETAASAEELCSQAQVMNNLLSRFKIKNNNPKAQIVNNEEYAPPPAGKKAIPPPSKDGWGGGAKLQPNSNETIISLEDKDFGRY